jgi:hypothetical protein
MMEKSHYEALQRLRRAIERGDVADAFSYTSDALPAIVSILDRERSRFERSPRFETEEDGA